ncbi:MAG: hypothetical protein RLZZ158_1663 [Cyanobacteriota bacterium]|jgi:hypothetical protein
MAPRSLSPQRPRRALIIPSILTALLTTAGLLLPEQPQLQQQICEQHVNPEACRVW